MLKFSLKQLIFANEICFPDTFVALFNKWAKETPNANMGLYYCHECKNRFNNNLITWMLHFSRADLDRGLGIIFENMLADLLQNKNETEN